MLERPISREGRSGNRVFHVRALPGTLIEKGGGMYRKLARVLLPLVVLAIIAACTIGLNGNCSGLGEWSIPAA